jgi:hypothetical protein
MPNPNRPQDVHIYLHIESVADNGKIDKILIDLEKIMASLDETLAAVQAETTVDDSIIALLNGLAAQIAAGGLSAADQAKVDAIFAQAQANAQKVSDAVTANTPAPPTP